MDFKFSSGCDVLVIRDNSNDPIKVAKILTIYKAVSGRYVGPLPKATTTHPMKDFQLLSTSKVDDLRKL